MQTVLLCCYMWHSSLCSTEGLTSDSGAVCRSSITCCRAHSSGGTSGSSGMLAASRRSQFSRKCSMLRDTCGAAHKTHSRNQSVLVSSTTTRTDQNQHTQAVPEDCNNQTKQHTQPPSRTSRAASPRPSCRKRRSKLDRPGRFVGGALGRSPPAPPPSPPPAPPASPLSRVSWLKAPCGNESVWVRG